FLLAPLIAMIVHFVRWERERSQAIGAARRILFQRESLEISRALARLLLDRPHYARRAQEERSWQAMVAELDPRPVAVVAPGLALEVRAPGRVRRFLEPHQIEPGAIGSQMLGGVVAAVLASAGAAVILYVNGHT